MSDDYKIIRTTDLRLIPKYLLEQVKDVYWTPEELYGLWPAVENSPTNLLYAVVNKDFHIKGVIWATVGLAGSFLFVNVVSLDKELQSKGLIPNLVMPYLQDLKAKIGVRHLLCSSSRPKGMEKWGWKIAKFVMEA